MLILPKPVADSGHDLLIFILHSNQKFAGFLGNVSSSKLIGADPCDGGLSAFKLHLLNFKGNVISHTDLVPIMTVNNDVIPNNNRIAVAVRKKVLL